MTRTRHHTDDVQNKDVEQIRGVNSQKAEVLREAGFENVSDVVRATINEIAETDGIGIAMASRVKKYAERILVEDVLDALQQDDSIELLDHENQGCDVAHLRVKCAVRAEDGLSLNYNPNDDSRIRVGSIGGTEPFYSITVSIEV